MVSSGASSRGNIAGNSSSCMYNVPGSCTYPYPVMESLDTCHYYASLQTGSGPQVAAKGPIGKSSGSKGRSSSSYKHIPHRDKPPHLVQRRNARERRRVQAVNSAFSRLRRHIPTENRNKRLSKVKTLKIAMDYIDHLRELITTYDAQVMQQQQQQQHGAGTWQQQQTYGTTRDNPATYYSAPQMYAPNV